MTREEPCRDWLFRVLQTTIIGQMGTWIYGALALLFAGSAVAQTAGQLWDRFGPGLRAYEQVIELPCSATLLAGLRALRPPNPTPLPIDEATLKHPQFRRMLSELGMDDAPIPADRADAACATAGTAHRIVVVNDSSRTYGGVTLWPDHALTWVERTGAFGTSHVRLGELRPGEIVTVFAWKLRGSGGDISLHHSTGRAPVFYRDFYERSFHRTWGGGLAEEILPVAVQSALSLLFVRAARRSAHERKRAAGSPTRGEPPSAGLTTHG